MSKSRVKESIDLVCAAMLCLFFNERQKVPVAVPQSETQILFASIRSEIDPGMRFAGICVRVAGKLGLTRQFVSEVLRRGTGSRRVVDGLTHEASLMTGEFLACPPLTVEERYLLKTSPLFSGVIASVATALGKRKGHVRAIARGAHRSHSVLNAIRDEMARRRNGGAK